MFRVEFDVIAPQIAQQQCTAQQQRTAVVGCQQEERQGGRKMTASKMESECRSFAEESFKCLEGYGTNRAKAKVISYILYARYHPLPEE